MKLAFSSNAFKQNTLAEAIGSIASAGYGGVELMADLHHAHPLSFDASRRREAARQLSDLGLLVTNVNAFTHFVEGDTYNPTWIDDDAARVRLRVEHTVRSIELAAEFACRTVSVQPGGPMIGRNISEAEARRRFADALGRCVDDARAHSVTLAIEPEPGLLIQSAGEYASFKQEFFREHPHVRMNCDVGHLFCVGDDPAAVIRTMKNDVAHVHLEDIGASRVHQHLTPGRGVMNFAAIFEALRDTEYDGHVTVELYPYESSAADVAQAAITHLRSIGVIL